MTAIIDINDELISETMRLSHLQSPQELVQFALSELLRKLKKQELAAMRGKVDWEGNLSEMRTISNE